MRDLRPGWLPAALAASGGALAGVLATLALGGGDSTEVRSVTVTTRADPGRMLIAKTAVPNVVGEPLDTAKDRVRRVGFIAEVQGGGILGVVRERNWTVTGQDPGSGRVLEVGDTVRLRVQPR
jgi:PASTA domain